MPLGVNNFVHENNPESTLISEIKDRFSYIKKNRCRRILLQLMYQPLKII